MLNHTYTSVKNANLVDCGKKQHIPSQPTPLLKENFLGEFRTELDKKKVLAALGIATELSLEWGNIKGNIGDSTQLMTELDARTTYNSVLHGMSKTIGEGIAYLESIVGGEEAAEEEQNRLIAELKANFTTLQTAIDGVQTYLTNNVDVAIDKLDEGLKGINTSIENITSLIKVSKKDGNALKLLTEEDGEVNPGLYVQDLSEEVKKIPTLSGQIADISSSLDNYITRSELGTGPYKFVSESTFNAYTSTTSTTLADIDSELKKTIKTGADGNVNTLGVNKIISSSKNIEIDRSLKRTTDAPLDIYCVRNSLQELYALDPEVCYAGMGVIVASDDPALYILRDPKGKEINSEYVTNPDNWKCPEDLVTVALSRYDYDELVKQNKTSDHIFYYVYEDDEIEYKPKPIRKEDESDAEYLAALDLWINHELLLPQEYLSAQWGVGIEKQLSKKAPKEAITALNDDLKQLQKDVAGIKGNGSGPSLESLGTEIGNLQGSTNSLISRMDAILSIDESNKESGRIPNIEAEVFEIKEDLGDYITKNELIDPEPKSDLDFVKSKLYDQDKAAFGQTIQTGQITATTSITTPAISIEGNDIIIKDARLQVNDTPIAFTSDLIKIETRSQDDYNKAKDEGKIENDVYYYVYDPNIDETQTSDLSSLVKRISELEKQVAELQKKLDNTSE